MDGARSGRGPPATWSDDPVPRRGAFLMSMAAGGESVVWRTATWAAPLATQILLGLVLVIAWLLGKWFPGTSGLVLFLIGAATVFFLLCAVLCGLLSRSVSPPRARGSDTWRPRFIRGRPRWVRHLRTLVSSMVKGVPAQRHTAGYGPWSLVAALFNVLVIELAVWATLPYLLLAIYVVPLIVVDLIVAIVLEARKGASGQVGRGMLIGLLCVPAGLIVLVPGFLAAQAAGLV